MMTTVTVPFIVVMAPLTSNCNHPPVNELMTRTVSRGVAMKSTPDCIPAADQLKPLEAEFQVALFSSKLELVTAYAVKSI